ncbi:MAG: TetR/AcrR family transcriptional regulator, partial [Clostridia bacterium]|nr:TetR/AcrR family transcriptional regulator [Clostridia bacterium]
MPYTEEYANHEELKKTLILEGIRQIEQNGINGLSLRKTATECGVSCAAPYRHFESKAGFIFSIISYVNGQWALLKDQISASFKDDKRQMIIETCAATVLFWRANPNFRSVIMLDDKLLNDEQIKEKNRISDEIAQAVQDLYGKDDSETTVFLVRSVLYGA